MDTARLIEMLSLPDVYPHPVDEVDVHQTHISAVFLAGPFAYKVKKPVDFGFVNFSTLDRRRHFCDEEVRLNRRLAPDVYRGVVPIGRSGDAIAVEGAGEVVEWAVKMERLDESATLRHLVEADTFRGPECDRFIEAIVDRLVDFYRRAERGPRVAEAADFEAVARNAEENFTQSEPLVGQTVSRPVFDRLRALTRRELERCRPLIEARAARGVPRDGHGDLRLDHIYHRPDRAPPADLVFVDCIEFNEKLRYVDPVADLAFLAMDLWATRGDRTVADSVVNSYVRRSGDEESRPLWPLFISYRAAVRAKVDGLAATQVERSDRERAEAISEARGHWLLALGALEEPGRSPCLVLVAGPPGVGKSTLARGLAERSGFTVIRSDLVRKELAGLAPDEPATARFGEGIYTAEWTDRTYDECLRRAADLLFEGRRVIVDATFASDAQRLRFLDLARDYGVRGVFMDIIAPLEVIRDRLARRSGDASDAGPEIAEEAFRRWERPSARIVQHHRAPIGYRDDPQGMIAEAIDRLGMDTSAGDC